jgi:hypothetical protein
MALYIHTELAQKIQEAFGPCSALYECMDLKEIQMSALRSGFSLESWLELQITTEEIEAERSYAYLGDDPGNAERHRQAIRESEEMVQGIRERVGVLLRGLANREEIDTNQG